MRDETVSLTYKNQEAQHRTVRVDARGRASSRFTPGGMIVLRILDAEGARRYLEIY
jgi:hypothetical protein